MTQGLMARIALKTAIAGVLVAPMIAIAGAPGASADAGDTLSTTGLGSDGQLGNGSTGNRTTFGAVNTLTERRRGRGRSRARRRTRRRPRLYLGRRLEGRDRPRVDR